MFLDHGLARSDERYQKATAAWDADAISYTDAFVSFLVGRDAYAEALGNLLLSATASGFGGAVAYRNLAAFITAGGDAFAQAYGTLSPPTLTAGGSALAASVGDASVNLTAGEDAALVTYGAFAGSVYAGRDVPFVGAVGNIGGSVTAARNIGLVASYGTIGAAISAGGSCPASSVPLDDPAYVACGVIDLVLAHGDIAGSIAAQNEIHAVHAAGVIAAAISAPVIGSVVELDTALLADPAPTIDTGPIMAAVSAAQAELAAWRAQLQADAVQFHADLAAARTDTLAKLTAVLADIAAEISAAQTDAAAALSAALTDAVAAMDAARLAALDARNTAISESSARRAADALELAARVTEGNAEHTLLTNAADAIRNQAQAQAAAKFDERVNVGIALSEQRARRDQAWIDAWNAIIVGVGDWLTPPGVDSTLEGIGDAFECLGGVWDRARGTGSGWLGAVYQVIGVGFYDLVGVTGIYNGISGEEIVTLEKLGPWERVTSFIDGSIRLATTVIGGTRAVGGVRAWRAGRCSWNPITNCFVAGTQVVVGEVVEESAAFAPPTGSPPWGSVGLTFALVGLGGVVLLKNRRRGKVKAVRLSAVDALFAKDDGPGDLPDSQLESDWDTMTDHLPELTLDEFEHLCDRLFATADEFPDSDTEPVGVPPGVGVLRPESSNGTLVVPALADRNRLKAALPTSPRAARMPHATKSRASGRRLSLLWLAACLIPAVFCFWQAAAPTPASPPPTASANVSRYITKSIEDIREGDIVLGREEFGRELGMKRVVETYRRTSDHLRILTFSAEDGTEQTLKTTNEHPFWAENRQAWIAAGDLQTGDTVTGPRGELQTLAATLYEPHPEGVPFCNFQVEEYHSYYVEQSANLSGPVLVHNADYSGRAGKQDKLRELLDDYATSAADKGWIQQELHSIERGQRRTVRVPPGKNLAHRRGMAAKDGFGYKFSDLQDVDLHKLQHFFEGY